MKILPTNAMISAQIVLIPRSPHLHAKIVQSAQMDARHANRQLTAPPASILTI